MAKKKSAGAKYFGKPLTDDPDDAPELLNDFFRDVADAALECGAAQVGVVSRQTLRRARGELQPSRRTFD